MLLLLPLLLLLHRGHPHASLAQRSPQSAALLLLSALVVSPSVLLALQERAVPPRLSVGRRAVLLPPGQKLPSGQGTQERLLPDTTWYVPEGHTAAARACSSGTCDLSAGSPGV
jgi:hypothetical protein